MNLGESAPGLNEPELLEPEAWALTDDQDGYPTITLYFKTKQRAEEDAVKWTAGGALTYVVPIDRLFQD